MAAKKRLAAALETVASWLMLAAGYLDPNPEDY
jgi:hypothetical protein